MEKARFHLPGLRSNYALNMFWVSLLETHPERFRDGVEIASFFGSFPFSVWNGGRLVGNDQCDAAFVTNVIRSINAKGLPVRFTFTNPVLTEQDLANPFCNFCMDAGNNGKNEVIVMSPILEEYLRKKYPSYAFNSSTCKEIRDIDRLNEELSKDYKFVVMDYNFNNDWETIKKIEKPEKLEVLINACCEPNCKRRGEHYKCIGENAKIIQKNRSLPPDKQIPLKEWHCKYADFNNIHTIQDYSTFIKVDDLWEKYMPLGINNFKIEGRTNDIFSLIDTYCYYMIKPEYVGDTRLLLIHNLVDAKVISVNRPRPSRWP